MNTTRTPIARACAAVLIAGTVGAFAPQLYAAVTAAGTQIKNQATVTYEDVDGIEYTATSNEAIVTVKQVYSATLGSDIDRSAGAGQTVYLPYLLTNTGNGTDTFDLTAANDASFGANTSATGIEIYAEPSAGSDGLPDPGATPLSSVQLAKGESVTVIVAVPVPASAAANDSVGIVLTAQAQQGTGSAIANSVDDVTPGNGRDGAEDTNQSLITVTDDAVLVATKSSVHDAVAQTLTYTIEVTNGGTQPARNVAIFDALPEGTTLVSQSASGLVNPGDTVNAGSTPVDLSETGNNVDANGDGTFVPGFESAINIDLNGDGDAGDASVPGVFAIDDELPPQTTVSLTFTVSYAGGTFAGGDVITNRAHLVADVDLDGNGIPDVIQSTGPVTDTIGATYAVDIVDLGDAASGDDDFLVDQAAAGGTVSFTYVVTNNGNATDSFDVVPTLGAFPAGTVFNFFDATGSVPLSSGTVANSAGTGDIDAGQTRTIVMTATLPAGTPTSATEIEATLLAQSVNDPATTPASDGTTASIGAIVAASADLHNAPGGTAGTDEDALTLVSGEYTAANTFDGTLGQTVAIPLYVDNASGIDENYLLSAGASWDGTALGAVPAGWSIAFFATDGAGNKTGNAITNTGVITAGTLDVKFIAEVTISSDPSQALEDVALDNDGDADLETLLGNADADGDYPIFFRIVSVNSGASDVKLDAIDVDSTRQLTLVPQGANQIYPGGTVAYSHTLGNGGSIAETVELTASNTIAGFTNTLTIDTDGDGTADTAVNAIVLVGGTATITVQQPDGTDVSVTVTDVDGDGVREFALEPGVQLPLTATVSAPGNAANGTLDTLTIVAENVDADTAAPDAQVLDRTTVTRSQVRLDKTVALDAGCDEVPDGAFEATLSSPVAPGECAIWQVIAHNQGASIATDVIISDTIPSFSDYEVETLYYCEGLNCSPVAVTDAPDTDAGTRNGSVLNVYVGTGAAPTATPPTGGTLAAGERATARFSVKVR